MSFGGLQNQDVLFGESLEGNYREWRGWFGSCWTWWAPHSVWNCFDLGRHASGFEREGEITFHTPTCQKGAVIYPEGQAFVLQIHLVGSFVSCRSYSSPPGLFPFLHLLTRCIAFIACICLRARFAHTWDRLGLYVKCVLRSWPGNFFQ